MVSLHVLGFGLDVGGWPLRLSLDLGVAGGHSPINVGTGVVLKNEIEFGKTRYNEN